MACKRSTVRSRLAPPEFQDPEAKSSGFFLFSILPDLFYFYCAV